MKEERLAKTQAALECDTSYLTDHHWTSGRLGTAGTYQETAPRKAPCPHNLGSMDIPTPSV